MKALTDYLCRRGHPSSQIMIWGSMNDSHRYRVYEIRQGRSGKRRVIEEPVEELKRIQKDLVPLFEHFPFDPACVARRGHGVSCNAAAHEGAKHVLRVDISKCYPSTTEDMITDALDRYMPDNDKKTLMFQAIHQFGVYRKNNVGKAILPTGAPTSPILCNIALTPIDDYIQGIAQNNGYAYTRYMDDIHISTKSENRDWSLLDNINDLLKQAGYKMNKKKSRWLWANTNDAMNITGVRLGTGPKVPRQFRRMIRAKLQNLAKQGKNLDAETKGCLAYIKSIDETRFHQLLEYYERRRAYAPSS